MSFSRKHIGHGIGLRPTHYARLLQEAPPVDWVEAISENFMAPGGRPVAVLEKVRTEIPVVLHGVSLSIGAMDPISSTYLKSLRSLADRIEPAWISDHLCWGSFEGQYAHDLLPLPQTEEALAHVVKRVGMVQDALQRQILLENVSSYVAYRDSTMSEWEFLSEVARQADCGILFDVNNMFVNAHNHGFDPLEYLDALPGERIGQIHLAGYSDKGAYLFDSHDQPICDAVWDLYKETLRRFGRISTLIEWDDNIPKLEELAALSRRAADVEKEVLATKKEVAA